MTGYAPLWCKTHFSFLEGASAPDELVEEARHLGLRSLAVTDRDGVYGIVRAHVAAKERGLHLIVGSEVSVGSSDNDVGHIVLLATDRPAYARLCKLVTTGRLRSEKGASRVTWDEVCAASEGLIALMTCGAMTCDLRDAFGDRLYALVTRHRQVDEPRREARLRRSPRTP
jgi:error-prone DNA polymerase